MKHPVTNPAQKPPIDRANASDVPPPAPAQAPQATAQASDDVPMPTVENNPPCVFKPGAGITTGDVIEIALMFWIQLTNSPVQVEKGALRSVTLSPERVEQLSDSARRFMTPLGQH
ncbi:hypothetical protein [Methylobacterium nodulans]|uniref:Uncharacterized protein n=1 Tax=Methylobacterium nodulans (strain LMG 21967 / CNCM I-2342 / ORS 2060) TaxID=460265 RepID=B8IRN5_METNO|nr:hypothetical protein [Methylobacterium nodulans]ACL60585.1 hypothetical protein Mnod_5756 [Methylobacterium nodulans ORS 2060]